MNLRDRREAAGEFEALIRQSLGANVAHKHPSGDVRRRLLQRAAGQQRRKVWRLPMSYSRLFDDNRLQLAPSAIPNHRLYIEALFGPRLGWFNFSQLMR